MTRMRTAAAILVGTLTGALSALLFGFVALVVLMHIGARYVGNYEFFLWLWWPLPTGAGLVGFYFPFRWILKRRRPPGDHERSP
jgi:hypothetical protein